jgi:hypothetical protein
MKISGILLFFLSGCLIQIMGQETLRFHSDPELFIQEARDFFGNRQPEASRVLLLKYETAQKEGLLEENHWIDLAMKANLLETTKGQPFPDFYLLLESFHEVATRTKSRSDYFRWSKYVDGLMQENRKSFIRIKSFLEFTINYSRNGILHQTSAFRWKVKPELMEFGMDSIFFVKLPPTDLIASGSGDSTTIHTTSGYYYPDLKHFKGHGGQITWERLNLQASQVYVKLNDYHLDLSRSVFEIDSVNLVDRRYFTENLLGRVENKILAGVSPEVAGYPKFTSYEHRNRIKNLYPGMDYEGGFSLHGNKVLGLGLASEKSVLIIYHNQRPLFRLASTYFLFQEEQARGINTEVSLYLDTDSIYHPGLLFQYNGKKREISLIRDGQGLSPSRFFNSYHNYDLDVAWIRWNIGDLYMTMTGLPGSNQNEGSFESSDFFNIDRYNEILVADSKHPVAAVKQCVDYYYSRTLRLDELAKFMNKPQHLVEEMVLRLSFLGFVRYNSENQIIDVQERTFDFLKKNAGLQDYDVIRFESVLGPQIPNAKLNLNNNHLIISGVKSVEISQKRQVVIFPKDETLEILKNRDILFDGEIQGGLVRFSGKDFTFNYLNFSIDLGKVDQIRMQVFEKQSTFEQDPVLVDVTSIIENTRGILKIDEPNNKSGTKADDFQEYPILQTDTNAYVYYDQKEILNGVYPRETFNFNISPFTLRGLNLMNFSDSLIFPGRFITSDIFPPLELSLRHQADHSLGFETLKTPEEGYPIYKGKGQFFNNLAMSKAGLKGSGRLEYLNSVLVSDDFLFLPEEVTTVAKMFTVSKDTTDSGNPDTRGELMAVRWYPNRDKLVAQGTKGPLNMYENGKFDGILSLDPEALIGEGTISFDGYSITSNEIKFYEDSFEAVDGVLKIFKDSSNQRGDSGKPGDAETLIVARQFNGVVNVAGQQAQFKPSGTNSKVEFTQNRYSGAPASFNWDIAKGLIHLEEVKFNKAEKPSDSLTFLSGKADFLLNEQLILAHNTDYIDVADVRIFPADRNLAIRKEAKIDSLVQATIVSRDSSLIHRITGATVTIIDHKKYTAKGYYQYKDISGREFPILFSEIKPDRSGISLGRGLIDQESSFSLSPAFKYFGSVEWNNNERLLLFEGHTQLSYTCPDITLQWIRFKQRISPDSVAIPIDSITFNDQDDRLFKGFYLSNQPIELYSTFVGPHTRYSDQPLISATGWMWYEEATGKYKVASADKKADEEADGTILTLDANACRTEASGPLTLGVDLGQVKLNGAGTFIHELRSDTIMGSVLLTIDFFMDPKSLDFLAKSINNASGLEPVNYGDPTFRRAFKYLVGKTVGEDLLNQISLTGKWKKIPDPLLHTLVLTNVDFAWNPATGSYQSKGKIGIGNIMGEPINKKMNGLVEVIHRRGGDVLSIYLEVDRQNYFFFTYSRGVLQCVAGPGFEKFNTMIRKTKENKRRIKVESGEAEYQYDIGTYAQVAEFLRRFQVNR